MTNPMTPEELRDSIAEYQRNWEDSARMSDELAEKADAFARHAEEIEDPVQREAMRAAALQLQINVSHDKQITMLNQQLLAVADAVVVLAQRVGRVDT